jgi:hypothetical protein
VLEEVGEAGRAGRFILGTHIVPDGHRYDRSLAVLVHDYRQTVVELEPGPRDIDLGDQFGDRRCRQLLGLDGAGGGQGSRGLGPGGRNGEGRCSGDKGGNRDGAKSHETVLFLKSGRTLIVDGAEAISASGT